MKHFPLLTAALLSFSAFCPAEDIRLQPPKELNGYFPFIPPSSLHEWDTRKDFVRRQILVAEGLWPTPTKTPLNPVIHGKIERDGYTVEKVYFESAPGFFVTGSLYRPTNPKGKVPGILFAHGHWQDARLTLNPDVKVRQEIAIGAERFENGGRSIFQSLCVQLARMGCVVWQWDMLSDSDSLQIPREIVHTFSKQRPEMNTAENWGLYSPQAEAHAQSIMGLQTWNAVRSLDFLLSLPEVDPERTAITGASGGGTQTMLLAAIDERIKLSFPCVMVSTSMQGGCTCENASLLRVNTGNIEFAGLFAPKPQGMNTANDWTKELSSKGFPELQKLYEIQGAKDKVFLLRGEHFMHNYNGVTRSAFYTFLNKHFKLGLPSPVIEKDYEPLTREQLTVWNEAHPAPRAADPDFERSLLKWFTTDSNRQLLSIAANPQELQNVLRPALEVIIGRTYENAGTVEWRLENKRDLGNTLEMTGTLLNKTYAEELPVIFLFPKNWNGHAIVWLDDNGKSSLKNPEIQHLLSTGAAVLGVDLLRQGGKASVQAPTSKNPREFAGFTYGYNHALFAQRTHDVLSVVRFLRTAKIGNHPSPSRVSIAAWGNTGPILAAARALAGGAIDRAACDTNGFRFGKILDYRDSMFLPAAAKYLDLPGILTLNAPHPLWIAGEGETPQVFGAQFTELFSFAKTADKKQSSAVEWLLK
ncbi:MAG: Cephalosporin-C deacetylase [Verrucomicrobia bacterium]|nr:MAG: Cephalosporin-C deacetylase [Verrucomicrobiota bacterium]